MALPHFLYGIAETRSDNNIIEIVSLESGRKTDQKIQSL